MVDPVSSNETALDGFAGLLDVPALPTQVTLASDGIANRMKPISDGNTHVQGNTHVHGNTDMHRNTRMHCNTQMHVAESAAAADKSLATGLGELFMRCSQESRHPLEGDSL